jgi:hypothetical protein
MSFAIRLALIALFAFAFPASSLAHAPAMSASKQELAMIQTWASDRS